MHNSFAEFAAAQLEWTDLSLPQELIRSRVALRIACEIRRDFWPGAPQYTPELADEVIAVMRRPKG